MKPTLSAYYILALALCFFLPLAGCQDSAPKQQEYIKAGKPSDYYNKSPLPAKEAKKQNSKSSNSSN